MSEPITFHIEPRQRSQYLAWLLVDCNHGVDNGCCRFALWDKPAMGNTMWQWNGSIDRPTITPSINCHGGCGRHFTITNGVANHA